MSRSTLVTRITDMSSKSELIMDPFHFLILLPQKNACPTQLEKYAILGLNSFKLTFGTDTYQHGHSWYAIYPQEILANACFSAAICQQSQSFVHPDHLQIFKNHFPQQISISSQFYCFTGNRIHVVNKTVNHTEAYKVNDNFPNKRQIPLSLSRRWHIFKQRHVQNMVKFIFYGPM